MEDFMTESRERSLLLLLEDDNAVRRSLHLLLQGRGFDVKAYASADAFLADPQALNAGRLLADYRLGTSDGITVLQTLRQRGWMGPAILMTAFGSDDLATRAASAGFIEVLEKPFLDHAVVAALTRASS